MWRFAASEVRTWGCGWVWSPGSCTRSCVAMGIMAGWSEETRALDCRRVGHRICAYRHVRLQLYGCGLKSSASDGDAHRPGPAPRRDPVPDPGATCTSPRRKTESTAPLDLRDHGPDRCGILTRSADWLRAANPEPKPSCRTEHEQSDPGHGHKPQGKQSSTPRPCSTLVAVVIDSCTRTTDLRPVSQRVRLHVQLCTQRSRQSTLPTRHTLAAHVATDCLSTRRRVARSAHVLRCALAW